MTSIRRMAARAAALSIIVAMSAGAQGLQGLLPTADSPPPSRAGTRGANWLHILIGARGQAMAGAVGSSVVGSQAWFYNPAGAATIEGVDIALGRQNLYGSELGIKQTYMAVSFPILGGAVGLAVNSLNSGDIPLTSEGTPFGDATLGQYFTWTSTAASLGYARRLTDRLDVGGSFKVVTEGLKQIKNSFIAGDVGTQFRTGLFGIVLGGSLMTVGNASAMNGVGLERGVNTNDVSRAQTRFKLYTRPVDLPTSFRFSLANDVLGSAESLLGRGSGNHTLLAEVNVNDAVDAASQMGLGVEYGFKNMVFARAGKRFFNDNRKGPDDGASYGMSAGFGFRIPLGGHPFRFDYSYTALGELRDIQVFSLELGGR
jgi:hypothetical protein